MDGLTESRAVRSQLAIAIQTNAPISATLEDCLQGLSRIRAALAINRPESNQNYVLADDTLSKLASWCHNSGATPQGLDRRLRWSVELHQQALGLLQHLGLVLRDGQSGLAPYSQLY